MLDKFEQQRRNIQAIQMRADPVTRETLHWRLIGVTQCNDGVQTETRKINLAYQSHSGGARVRVAGIGDAQQWRGIHMQLQYRLCQQRARHAPQAGQI